MFERTDFKLSHPPLWAAGDKARLAAPSPAARWELEIQHSLCNSLSVDAVNRVSLRKLLNCCIRYEHSPIEPDY